MAPNSITGYSNPDIPGRCCSQDQLEAEPQAMKVGIYEPWVDTGRPRKDSWASWGSHVERLLAWIGCGPDPRSQRTSADLATRGSTDSFHTLDA